MTSKQADCAKVWQDYIDQVLATDTPAGALEVASVERFQADLCRAAEDPDCPFIFDAQKASKAVAWFGANINHTVGKYASKPFRLTGWQAFVIANLVGFRMKATGFRRFLRAYICVSRKQGKSTFAAAAALYFLKQDEPDEVSGQTYCVATTRQQAALVYDECRRMNEYSGKLALKEDKTNKKLIRKRTRSGEYDESFIQPLSSEGKSKDGLSPSVIVLDELHAFAHHHQDLLDKIRTAGAARNAPLEICITTSGDDQADIWLGEDQYNCNLLNGEATNDAHFAFIARIDPADDPFDESVWRKAAPNLGVSCDLEYLRTQAKEAMQRPDREQAFIRYHMNRVSESTFKPIKAQVWKDAARARPDATPEDLANAPVYLGLDLGGNYDWSALAAVWDLSSSAEPHYWLKVWNWTCAGGFYKELINKPPWSEFIKRGELVVHEGTSTDFSKIQQHIVDFIDSHNVQSLVFDAWGARAVAGQIEETTGCETFKFTQSHANYNEPLRRTIKAIEDGHLFHDGQSCLTWQCNNLVILPDRLDRWMPHKPSDERKVDGMVATILACSELFLHEGAEDYGFYESGQIEMA